MPMPVQPFHTSVADEFRANPFGEHSLALQRVLNIMRGASVAEKHVLICAKPYREWMLGQLSGQPGVPVRVFLEHRFKSLEEAEWFVFKLRWKALTGELLTDSGEHVDQP